MMSKLRPNQLDGNGQRIEDKGKGRNESVLQIVFFDYIDVVHHELPTGTANKK